MLEFLTLEDVLELHSGQIKRYGGSEGLRSGDLLQSAIAQPQVTFDGQFLHIDNGSFLPIPSCAEPSFR